MDDATWTMEALARLMGAVADQPYVEAEITAMEVTVQGGQRNGEAVSMTPFNGWPS